MIEALIDDIAAEMRPIDGDNLLGFRMDADHYISLQSSVADVAIVTQELKPCRLRFDVTISTAARTLQDVTGAFAAAWRDLAYGSFEASSIGWYSDCVLLRFVTALPDTYFVSGAFFARGPLLSELVRAFDRDFSRMRGPLKPLPPTVAQRLGLL